MESLSAGFHLRINFRDNFRTLREKFLDPASINEASSEPSQVISRKSSFLRCFDSTFLDIEQSPEIYFSNFPFKNIICLANDDTRK